MLERNGSDSDGGIAAGRDKVALARLRGKALQLHLLTGRLGVRTGNLVVFDALQQVLAALAGDDMLNAHIHALLNVARAHLLVHDDAKGALGDVEDDTGLAVVELVRHALLHSPVGLDVHVVADLVDVHVGARADHAVLAELAGKGIAGARAITVRVSHNSIISRVEEGEEGKMDSTCSFLGHPGFQSKG